MPLKSYGKIGPFLVAISLVLGCQSEDPPVVTQQPPTVESLAVLTAEQENQKQLALSARDDLFAALLNELVAAMGEKGPARSIAVCKTRAPEVAAEVSSATGVRIGRTSFKLRNEANQPPAWANSFVADQVNREVTVELPNQELGVLLPIRLKSTCLLCHGGTDQVMPDVKAAIVANYANDQATGFAEGDLRGYFWVEVPSPSKN